MINMIPATHGDEVFIDANFLELHRCHFSGQTASAWSRYYSKENTEIGRLRKYLPVHPQCPVLLLGTVLPADPCLSTVSTVTFARHLKAMHSCFAALTRCSCSAFQVGRRQQSNSSESGVPHDLANP